MLVGSSINQMVFAQTSDSYKERDFQVRSCLSLGVTNVFGLAMCAGIKKNEKTRVSKMSMKDDLVIRGGTAETRNKLMQRRTEDLIEQFMNEAKTTNTAVQYILTSLWDILQPLYVGRDAENYIRAVNLQNYYLGFKNYGCDYKVSGKQTLQMFNFTKDSSPTLPQYECSLAPEGCHQNSDCHYRPFKSCACKGSSCIRYKYKTLPDTGERKTTAYINGKSWKGPGCHGRGFKCHCTHPSEERHTVWRKK